jgi:hypothetical protein
MDHLERAKREEVAPLIEAAYQHGLVEERILHEREQQVCLLVFSRKQFNFCTIFLSSWNKIFFLSHSIFKKGFCCTNCVRPWFDAARG